MSIAYQYDAKGYFVGEVQDYGLLPNNATKTAPELQDDHIPRWNGKKWELVENHKGEEGYVGGKSVTIKEYGQRPDGWSTTPPPPTEEELQAQRRAAILSRLQEIDADSVRPLRALANGEAEQEDRDKLTALDVEAEALRLELAEMPQAATVEALQ